MLTPIILSFGASPSARVGSECVMDWPDQPLTTGPQGRDLGERALVSSALLSPSDRYDAFLTLYGRILSYADRTVAIRARRTKRCAVVRRPLEQSRSYRVRIRLARGRGEHGEKDLAIGLSGAARCDSSYRLE